VGAWQLPLLVYPVPFFLQTGQSSLEAKDQEILLTLTRFPL